RCSCIRVAAQIVSSPLQSAATVPAWLSVLGTITVALPMSTPADNCRRLFAAMTALALFSGAAWAEEMPEPRSAEIPARTFPLLDFGGKGDGATLNTEAFREAIAACAKAGGGRVIVPAGVFVTGPFELVSSTALVLERGAVIQA